ncbi:WD40 repeat-like protein [Eremomyces bilateralis CBS 781.70]|uniref:WD40 repeat-like protein n=1 Tax=Eremomyces bilateralis CBS 781.70 TaxID=1392243 RepID=A0A6G1FSY1_9PEZI|nr:WD40 repeat-like protein [Eremomyces bilateralis CBS 781.70]KAF1808897.1 WD40 repeat-like protein [Eremomyces bilateralis CBS 781.70]
MSTPSTAPRMNPPLGLRLTPSNSPFARHTPVRSPTKPSRNDICLSLKQVIGTTANSPNALDSLPSSQTFAFTAGAAAVVASVEYDGQIKQRFFRARPTAVPLNPISSVYGPSTPVASDARARTTYRESSPFFSPLSDATDSPSAGKSWTARERVKTATCISFSPDGRYLAVGEAGYRPRVLVFSIADDAPSDTPVSSLPDHSFGVRSVAFSPDSQYLATLGFTNDGFLYIWGIGRNGATNLIASNRCTSNINGIAWIGNSLVTAGTRHIKVWRVEDTVQQSLKFRAGDSQGVASPNQKTLIGRNCLLGPLLDSNFTTIVPIGTSKAVLGTGKGDICLMDDSSGQQQFARVVEVGFSIKAMAVDSDGLLQIAGKGRMRKSIKVDDLMSSETVTITNSNLTIEANSDAVALGPLVSKTVVVDSQRAIQIHENAPRPSAAHQSRRLPGHAGPILGIMSFTKTSQGEPQFFTWSGNGTTIAWLEDGASAWQVQVELPQTTRDDQVVNELCVVRGVPSQRLLATGDKVGMLRILDFSGKEVFTFKAHVSEITDIAVQDGDEVFLATASRDRTIQIFKLNGDNWELVQTLDEHVGAVTGIDFSKDGTRLISASSDRTMVIRESASYVEDGKALNAYLISRTVTLKATPTSMTLSSAEDNVLIVATIDRHLHRYDLKTGHTLTSFKTNDSEGGDPVVLSSIVHFTVPSGTPMIAGVSSTDKSVRVYTEKGSLVARDWGHTEGVSGLALISTSTDQGEPQERRLVTTAFDGTIFLWDTQPRPSAPGGHEISKSMDLMGVESEKEQGPSHPPLRRVLSHSEMARFQRRPDEPSTTPVGNRSPRLKKRTSRFTLAQAPKLDPTPTTTRTTHDSRRKTAMARSPSPPSPNSRHAVKSRRSSVDVRSRAARSTETLSAPPVTPSSSMATATEHLCRALRAYRRKLAHTSDNLKPDAGRELEKELSLTMRAVGERSKARVLDEGTMIALLDRHGKELMEEFDARLAAGLARAGEAQSPSPGGGGSRKGSEDRGADGIEAEGEFSGGSEERSGDAGGGVGIEALGVAGKA